MQLRHDFTVPVDPDRAFAVLTDMERVAACMPGAKLEGRDGDRYSGSLRLKVGPVTASYAGEVVLTDRDAAARRARLRASGSETHGQGSVAAVIDAGVSADGEGSRVEVVTDLELQGRAAQFGRGVVSDVAERILAQFARNLAAAVADDHPAPAAAPDLAEQEPVALDLGAAAALPLLKRGAPALAALLVGLLLGRLLGRRAAQPVWYPPPPWWWGPPPPP